MAHQFSGDMLWDIDINHTIPPFLDPSVEVSVGIGLTTVNTGTTFAPHLQTYKPSVMELQLVGDWIRMSNEFGPRKCQR